MPQCIDQAYATLDLMTHFTIGGDETCLLASDESVKIIGDAEKRKHEINTGNSRTSITINRTGSAAGATGPTAFMRQSDVAFTFFAVICQFILGAMKSIRSFNKVLNHTLAKSHAGEQIKRARALFLVWNRQQ